MSRLKSLLGTSSPSATNFLAVVVALVGLVPQYLSRTIPDVAFPLWAAGRVLDGATLYIDILEINPPLFIWLDIPIVALARWTGLDPILVYRLAVTALLVASAWASWRLLVVDVEEVEGVEEGTAVDLSAGGAERLSSWRSISVLPAIVFALFVLPRLDWGEREHMALALMLPWIAVAVRRVEGRDVSRRMALVTGLAAGVGIALKPHFVLVWVGREAALWLGGSAATPAPSGARGRLGGQGGRLDSWAPVAVCVGYLVAAIIVTPEYFSLVRELAGPYSQFIRATVLETMYGPAPAVTLTAIVVATGLRKLVWGPDGRGVEAGARRSRLAASAAVLLCATAAWAVVALLQLKGFRYHWYPAMALGFLLLCQLALVARGVHISFTSRLFRAVGTAVVVTTVVLTTWGAVRQAATPLAPEWDADPSIGLLLEALKGRVEPGDTLAVLSPNMASGFPLTNYLGTVWPLRLSNVWPAVVAYRQDLDAGDLSRIRPAADMTELESWALTTTAADLIASDPEWLLLFRVFDQPNLPYMLRTNFPAFVQRDRQIDSLLGMRDSIGTVGLYSIWSRAGAASTVLSLAGSSVRANRGVAAGTVPALAPGAAAGVLIFAAALALSFAGMPGRRNRLDRSKQSPQAQGMAEE